jgi:hypothetical protein
MAALRLSNLSLFFLASSPSTSFLATGLRLRPSPATIKALPKFLFIISRPRLLGLPEYSSTVGLLEVEVGPEPEPEAVEVEAEAEAEVGAEVEAWEACLRLLRDWFSDLDVATDWVGEPEPLPVPVPVPVPLPVPVPVPLPLPMDGPLLAGRCSAERDKSPPIP